MFLQHLKRKSIDVYFLHVDKHEKNNKMERITKKQLRYEQCNLEQRMKIKKWSNIVESNLFCLFMKFSLVCGGEQITLYS